MSDILFEKREGLHGSIGLVSLNRPKALNALNYEMICSLHAQLIKWADDSDIRAVIIQATEGRAFCAGGDIRHTYDYMLAHDAKANTFFRDEYQLNRYIYNYPKPYIALLDGITMGGGVGISVHGSHRVASHKLTFAMPETGIGFFPDVGGTYFLPRLPAYTGYYLGLTGARINSDDCIELGIVQYKLESENFPVLIKAITDTSFGDNAKETVSQVINNYAIKPDRSRLIEEKLNIEQCFSKKTVEEILIAMDQINSQLTIKARSMMMSKSPTSLKVTLAALNAGARLDFDECMQQEFRLASRFINSHDFPEGVRATLIDRDQTAKWQPPTLGAVANEAVEAYFEPLEDVQELMF